MKAQIHSGRGEKYRCAQCTVVHCSLFSPTSYLLLFSAVGGGLEVLRTFLCLSFFFFGIVGYSVGGFAKLCRLRISLGVPEILDLAKRNRG